MPLQNRVTPFGEIVADPARGLLLGNRGVLHDEHQRLGVSRWRMPHWVTCVLQFKDRHRVVMTPRRYTELFFLDEAVALAAGHRPCAECRRADYNRFRDAYAQARGLSGRPYAKEMDAVFHPARIAKPGRVQRRYRAPLESLPDGAFAVLDASPDTAYLVWRDALLPFASGAYGAPRQRPLGPANGEVTVLTPAPTVATLAAGYRPIVHPSAALGSDGD